jgi:hypothetical protein
MTSPAIDDGRFSQSAVVIPSRPKAGARKLYSWVAILSERFVVMGSGLAASRCPGMTLCLGHGIDDLFRLDDIDDSAEDCFVHVRR